MRTAALTANYNCSKYITDAIWSVAFQTQPVNMHMIIDDGSIDNSWTTICNYFDIDPSRSQHEFSAGVNSGTTYLLLQLSKNVGVSTARNIGLQYLSDKSDAIFIADADDVYYETKVEKSIKVLEKFPQVSLVYSDYDVEDLRTGKIVREFKEPFSFKRLSQECIVSNNSCIRTKILEHTGGYDVSMKAGEDYDLWLRIAEKAGVYHIPESLYRYRLTGQNATLVIPPSDFASDVSKVYKKAAERMNQNGN